MEIYVRLNQGRLFGDANDAFASGAGGAAPPRGRRGGGAPRPADRSKWWLLQWKMVKISPPAVLIFKKCCGRSLSRKNASAQNTIIPTNPWSCWFILCSYFHEAMNDCIKTYLERKWLDWNPKNESTFTLISILAPLLDWVKPTLRYRGWHLMVPEGLGGGLFSQKFYNLAKLTIPSVSGKN
jgi:hypothetical protein